MDSRANAKQASDEADVQKIAIGNVAPDFTLTCREGKEVKLSDYRGTKVMLCFFRHAYCPAVANSIGKLVGNYKKLAWASKLKVITVFRTDMEHLRDGLEDENAPISHFISQRTLTGDGTGSGYPFIALADPDGTAASTYKVGSKSTFLFLLDIPTYSKEVLSTAFWKKGVLKKNTEEEANTPGAANLLPSEFLIDENGVVVDILRAKKASDTMALDRITNFLIASEKEKRYINNGGASGVKVSGLGKITEAA